LLAHPVDPSHPEWTLFNTLLVVEILAEFTTSTRFCIITGIAFWLTIHTSVVTIKSTREALGITPAAFREWKLWITLNAFLVVQCATVVFACLTARVALVAFVFVVLSPASFTMIHTAHVLKHHRAIAR
jgi:hypothetical protein